MKEVIKYLYTVGFAQAPTGTEDTSGGSFICTTFPIDRRVFHIDYLWENFGEVVNKPET